MRLTAVSLHVVLCVASAWPRRDVDLAVPSFSAALLRVALNDGNARFSPSAGHELGSRQHIPTAADFDGDGRLDLATANDASNTISLFFNRGSS